MADLYKSKVWLAKKYVKESMSAKDIAGLCNTSEMTVFRWLRKFGLMK